MNDIQELWQVEDHSREWWKGLLRHAIEQAELSTPEVNALIANGNPLNGGVS